jgi:hypothetical protein
MVIYDKFKTLEILLRIAYGPIISNRGSFSFSKTGTIDACFHKLGKVFWDMLRLKINLRTGTNISEQPL